MLVRSGSISFIILVTINAVIGFAILAQIDVLADTQIPNLMIASQLWPMLAHIFGVLVFAAIYTTACPLLWMSVSRFTKEGTGKFKILTVILASTGYIVALFFPFNILMNVIYVINGYLGFLILVIMVIKMAIMFSGVREENRNQFSKEECLWIKRE